MYVFGGFIIENDICFIYQILVFKMIEYFKIDLIKSLLIMDKI